MTGINVLLFSVIAFLGFSIFLTIAHALERRTIDRIRNEPDGLSFSAIAIELAFDPDHAILWDTQVPALQLINSAGPHGAHIRRLYAWYCRSAALYPELYEGSSFKQWLEFLERVQLITRNPYRVALTPEGRDFLRYRLTTEPVSLGR